MLFACRKDKVLVPYIGENVNTDSCVCESAFESEGYSTGFVYDYDSVNYKHPKYNPNNENEIIFTEQGPGTDILLYKFNLTTQSKSLVYQGPLFGPPQWGKNDWIIFTRGYHGVYRIRPDGTNLSLLIASGTQFHPVYNQTGDKILTYHGFTPTNDFFQAKIWNTEGILIDSLNYDISYPFRWDNQYNIASLVGGSLLIIDPIGKNVIREYPSYFDVQDNMIIHDFIWLNEDEALVSKNGLYRFDVWSGQKEKLACGCSSLIYKNGDANENGTEVLFNKVKYDRISNDTINVRSSIVIFNVESNTFKKIDVP
tara:strand:+ start:9011 stop:9946 length:936 start_codon:yes stop_codon:yes gene_type:complete